MGRVKVCHIVNWYPNKWNEKEALWTKKHIESLDDHVDNEVYHVQVRGGKLGFHHYKISDFEEAYIITTNIKIWFVIELLTTLLLVYVLLFKVKRRSIDVYNFHITYPLLTYSWIVNLLISKPIFVTDHWSAYHFNFGVKKRLKRIERIFRNNSLNFICVSKALASDMQNFAKKTLKYVIIPNVIDSDIFSYQNKGRQSKTLFMVSFWKYPKDPILIFKAVKELVNVEPELKLIVGGFGPLEKEMTQWISDHQMDGHIEMVGQLDSIEIAEYLNESTLFLHNSDYEIASVVCMEAICCGCPVVASAVGGIPEFITEENGVLVGHNNVEDWTSAISKALGVSFNYERISKEGLEEFAMEKVGERYAEVLKEKVK